MTWGDTYFLVWMLGSAFILGAFVSRMRYAVGHYPTRLILLVLFWPIAPIRLDDVIVYRR